MKSKKKLIYIADFSLPNMSAYMLHVLKMCDAMSEKKFNVTLFIPFVKKGYSFNYFKSKYLLKTNFTIESFFNKPIKRGFFSYLLFAIKILIFIKKKNNLLIISRSIIPALVLSLTNYNVLLEIHTEMRGLTKAIFKIIVFFNFDQKLKYILIHKKLNEKLQLHKKKFIVLDDCVDIRDFKKNVSVKNECVYTGSYVDGKGLNVILNIAKRLPDVKFNLYGNIRTIKKELKSLIIRQKNIKLNNYITYNKIPDIIKSNKVLLMPYEEKINVLIKNLDVSSYISPLKLFDYLASGSTIIATDKPAYSHILKNNFNSILISTLKTDEWVYKIKEIFNNKHNTLKIKKNALRTAKKYTWLSRCEKIINFI